MTSRTLPRSARAAAALSTVTALQTRLVASLEAISRAHEVDVPFVPVEWLRDGGRHGGGIRYETGDTPIFDRASVNVSQVHYDDAPERRLGSATALSSIVHPRHPHAPSMHLHVSWTEYKRGPGYWRIMADLNPSHPETVDATRFEAALEHTLGAHHDDARANGDRYFAIPALDRHRGVVHAYLEGFSTEDFEADRAFAERVEAAVVDAYADTLAEALEAHGEPTEAERARQLRYHTVYAFQVLTLDRGTTSGLLIHDDNDEGILGSLPSHVDRELLASWADAVPALQKPLVEGLVDALPDDNPALIDVPTKRRLCEVVRQHYRAHPEALELQARGDVVPPTVANHR